MKKWKSWKESFLRFLSQYSKRTIGIFAASSVVVLALIIVLVSAGVTTIKQKNEAKKDLSGSSLVLENATATPNSSSILELENSTTTNSPTPTETPSVTVVINENTTGTIDNPNLTIDENGNYIASNVPEDKKDEYKDTINKTNDQMKDSNSNGVLEEGQASGEVTDDTGSLGGEAATEEPQAPSDPPSTAKPIFDGNYSDYNLPEYLYTYPLTNNTLDGNIYTNDDWRKEHSNAEIDTYLSMAKTYMNDFFTISYTELQSEEEIQSKLYKLYPYFHPNDTKKDNKGNRYSTEEYVKEWLNIIRDTKTTLTANFYTNNKLIYGSDTLLIRGIFEFNVITSEDTNKLLQFSKLLVDFKNNSYFPAKLNTKYYCGIELEFMHKAYSSDSLWKPNINTIKTHRIFRED